MDSTGPTTAILPIGLGAANAYDGNIFPLAYYQSESHLDKGVVLIRATLEEMHAIRDLGVDLSRNKDFLFDMRRSLQELNIQRNKLQDAKKTLNPIKALLNYRAVRLFHAATRNVYIEAMGTTEKLRREAQAARLPQVVLNNQVQVVDGMHLQPGVMIGGFAIDLPEGFNDIARKTINDATESICSNPFDDDSCISQLREGEYEITLADTESLLSRDFGGSDIVENETPTASGNSQPSQPTSPQLIEYHYHITNSIVATNSNFTAPTLNQGTHLSGSSVSQFTS